MTSQAAGCNIVPIGVTGTSSSNLGVTDQTISYEESTCWSSLYGSLGYRISRSIYPNRYNDKNHHWSISGSLHKATSYQYPMKSYTGYIKYIRRIGSFDSEIGEDFKITCKQDFKEIELNDNYAINFFGGFRKIST